MSYHDGDDWLFGQPLAEWLLGRIGSEALKDEALQRRITDWRRGGSLANVYVVDEHLTRHGLHLEDVPAECWVPDSGGETRHRVRTRLGLRPSRQACGECGKLRVLHGSICQSCRRALGKAAA